ncbi:hypothetical protein [Euzebya rosea]|uniref:hypothetical protein n=1 Tax=Euzebya rosea TaxID=2052804 RepID=UPI001300950F|nr:hypothetical protein [Euzebya rosea]
MSTVPPPPPVAPPPPPPMVVHTARRPAGAPRSVVEPRPEVGLVRSRADDGAWDGRRILLGVWRRAVGAATGYGLLVGVLCGLVLGVVFHVFADTVAVTRTSALGGGFIGFGLRRGAVVGLVSGLVAGVGGGLVTAALVVALRERVRSRELLAVVAGVLGATAVVAPASALLDRIPTLTSSPIGLLPPIVVLAWPLALSARHVLRQQPTPRTDGLDR